MANIVQQDRLSEQKHQTFSKVWRIVAMGSKPPAGQCAMTRVQYKIFTNRLHEQGLRGHHAIGVTGIIYDYPYIHGCQMVVDEANHQITLQADSDYALRSMAGSLHLPSRSTAD